MMKFKVLLVGSLVAIGAMALLANSINEKEKQRCSSDDMINVDNVRCFNLN